MGRPYGASVWGAPIWSARGFTVRQVFEGEGLEWEEGVDLMIWADRITKKWFAAAPNEKAAPG